MKAIAVNDTSIRPILTITGSDGTGGAGVQADIRMIASLGGYAVSAITSVTVQNTLGIQQFFDLPADIVEGQIEAIVNDVQPCMVKIGMVRQADVLRTVTDALKRYAIGSVICDPVIRSSNGEVLMTDEVVEEMKMLLLPLCSLVVMKREDAEYMLHSTIETNDDLLCAAREILACGCGAVLLQGGRGLSGLQTDVLITADESQPHYFSSADSTAEPWQAHGQSGHLSSAVATFMSQGQSVTEAVTHARTYINQLPVFSSGLVGRSSELYNDFINEVATHHKTNSDVRYYADRLNVSSRYLAQVSKRIAGKSPKSIIDEYLMQEIELLLTSTDKTVQEIAYECGFRSQAHFSKFFRKMKDCTPSEYRKNVKPKQS